MRFLRLARVVLGVTAASAAAGAAAGMLCCAALALIFEGPRGVLNGDNPYAPAAAVGGICGLLLGPAAAFGFLRRVPLGRLFAETALGAALGGLLGFAAHNVMTDLAVAAAGFAVAVAHLAWRYRARGADAKRVFGD